MIVKFSLIYFLMFFEQSRTMHAKAIKLIIFVCITTISADQPCIPRHTKSSVFCVCNTTYCDTVSRQPPLQGQYVTYTSSKSGLRFSKSIGNIERIDPARFDGKRILKLNPKKLYQTIEGFGGAVTDSAGLNWKSLPTAMQQYLIDSYCSEDGIEYNMIRVPNGSTDFSTRFWTYNEFPAGDKHLSNFTLAPDDISYKIPMIHACMKASASKVEIISSTWSPPRWMLSEDMPSGFRTLKEQYYQTYADYNCKFAQLYETQGIKIWGMSAVNEPLIPIMAAVKDITTTWTTKQLAKFMGNHFGPTIRNCSVKGIRILGVEDERFTVPLWFNELKDLNSAAVDYMDGIALHFYSDPDTSPAVLPRALRNYPDKFAISTEACILTGNGRKVDLGSWDRAKQYIFDILENLNYDLVGWVDWNMCLDLEGGPTWRKNFVDSPIIVDANKKEFYKQPMFYALGHFAKFVPRGSRRIKIGLPGSDPYLDFQNIQSKGQNYFDNVAFVTPRSTIVVIIYNEEISKTTAIQYGDRMISVTLPEESITTVEFPANI